MIKKLIVGSLAANCYVVYDTNNFEAFLIDPGDSYKKINHFLKDNELILKGIFLTHGHIDHIGATHSFLVDNPNLPVYIHEEDAIFLSSPEMNLSSSFGLERYILKPNVLIKLKNNEEIAIANTTVKCCHFPGHTPGSCMYFLEKESVIFSGDVLFSKSIGRFDLPYGNRVDTINSLRKIKEIEKDYIIYPGHEEKTSLHDEQTNNPYLLQI